MADEIVAVYRAEVEQYKKAVDDLTSKVNALDKAQNKVGDDAQADFGKGSKAVGGMSASVTSLTTQMKSLAAAVGIAFTVDRVVAFARESVKLAASAEGVERAFRRVGSPQLLEGLRQATRGTVSDLQLMQNAVKASNFQIPLENLASLFKFAQARARETGESVDFLVDSIILGIGRKSPLILDNLGISAVALREKFNGLSAEAAGVGDVARAVGEIADAELLKMGEQADTTADKLARLNAQFINLKTGIGSVAVEVAYWANETTAGAENLAAAIGRQLAQETDAEKLERQRITTRFQSLSLTKLEIATEELKAAAIKLTADDLQIQSARSKQAAKDAQFEAKVANDVLQARLRGIKERQDGLDEEGLTVDELNKRLAKAAEEDAARKSKEIRNVFFLTKAIKDLTEEQEAQGTSVERVYEINKLLPPLREELARLLGQETEATRKAREEAEKAAKAEKDRIDNARRMQEEYTAAFLETMNMRMDAINAFYDEQQIGATREIADAQERARVLEEIERNRLREQITLLQAFGLAATSERLKLAQSEAKILDDADALYKRFLEGQEADHAASLEKRKKAEQEAKEKEIELFNQYAQGVQSLIQGISNAVESASQYELSVIQNQLDQGMISQEEYDERRKQILRKQASDAKAVALMNAIIGTAVAVVNALALGPPQGYILAAISAALGAIEIATISAQPLPQFATGVIGLQGAGTETSDSILARLSKGESVMTAAETKKYRPLLEGMRKGTLEDIIQKNYVRPAIDAALLSGFADMGKSANLQSAFNDMNLLRAIDRHRETEVGELRMMNALLSKYVRTPKRGYA
jgi:hypothetical protein